MSQSAGIHLALYKADTGVFTELPARTWTLVDPATVDIILKDGDPETALEGLVNGFIGDPVAPAAVDAGSV